MIYIQRYNEVCIKTRSTPASLLFRGLVTEHRTGTWSIGRALHRYCTGIAEVQAFVGKTALNSKLISLPLTSNHVTKNSVETQRTLTL